jgi:hypothetical protein
VSSYDLSSLAPADALIALRSFPRRYREALRPLDDDQVEELALRPGPDGRSAVEITIDTVRTWTIQQEALRQIRLADTPVVHPAVIDPAQRAWDANVTETLDEALAQVDDRVAALVDEVERVGSTGWTRSATAAGGGSITALDLVRESVKVGRDNLVAAEKVLDSHRR